MRIRNAALAGTALALRSGVTVLVDADGWADVPDQDGQQLLQTPGWTGAKSPGRPLQAAKAPAWGMPGSAPAPAPEKAPEPPPEAPAPVSEEAEEEAAEAEGPDLGPLTKRELIQVADQYGVQLGSKQLKMRTDDLRAWLDEQLFEADDAETED